VAESKVEIWNMSLAHLGQSDFIGDVDERSKEAGIFRLFHDTALQSVLRDFPWPTFTVQEELSHVEDEPTDEWLHSYTYPPLALKVFRIFSGQREDTLQSRIDFKVVKGSAGGQLIYCDLDSDDDEVIAEYTVERDDIESWPADFVLAYSYFLASIVAPSIVGNESRKAQADCMAMYQGFRQQAEASAANEIPQMDQPDPQHIRER
jgi:hypothetical protein